MKRFLTGLLLAMALVTNVCALEVPIDTTVQNLNGSQQLIKTYTLPPALIPRRLSRSLSIRRATTTPLRTS